MELKRKLALERLLPNLKEKLLPRVPGRKLNLDHHRLTWWKENLVSKKVVDFILTKFFYGIFFHFMKIKR